jgi:hypothetical protein
MKLSAPKVVTFWLSVVVVVIGLISAFTNIPTLSNPPIPLLIVTLGFIILALGNLIKGW